MTFPKPSVREKRASRPIARTAIKPKCECGHAREDHQRRGDHPSPCVYGFGCNCREFRIRVRKPARSSPLKRGTGKPARTKPVARKSKNPLPKVRDKVWDLFAAYVKQRDGNVCFSCGKGGLESRNWHAGHMFPSGNNAVLRYEPKNVHSQCGRCNCFLGGNGAAYVAHFLEVYGLAELQRIQAKRGQEKRWTRVELLEMGEMLLRGGADFECWYAERYGL